MSPFIEIIGEKGGEKVEVVKKYIPYFVLFTALVIDLIIFYAILDLLKVFEKEIIAALIGFIGSVIGGLLTLIGVKWTLDSQQRKERLEKYEKANFVFTELLPKLTEVYNNIKSLNPSNWAVMIDKVVENSKALEKNAADLSIESMHIDIEFYRAVKSIEYYAGVIWDSIENYSEGKTDQEILRDISPYYQGLAKADNKLLEIVNEIKHL
jgi:hypothetical protein